MRHVVVGVVALSLTGLGGAHATPGAPTIVLESHVGQRAPDVQAALAPVLDELERLGFAAHPGSIEKLLGGRAPRPGRLDEGASLADIKQLVALGQSAFDKAKLEEAAAAQRRAVELIRRNPALLVLDTNNEKVTYSAFVGLSLALFKLKRQPEATDVMLQLLRMSSRPIPEATFGPKAQEIHNNAEKEAQAMGRGSLAVDAHDPRAMIFVDQKFAGMGQIALGDLIAGSHYVFVQMAGTGGLQYMVTVQADKSTQLDVNWPVESTVHLDDAWAGFLFATEIERGRESFYASDLVRRLGRADLIVLRTAPIDGVLYVIGRLYPASGAAPIGAQVPLNAGEAMLRSLARFLYDGTTAAGLRVLPHADNGVSATVAVTSSNDRPRHSMLPPATTAVGTLAIAFGSIEYLRHPYDPKDGTTDDGRDPFVGAMLGGSAVLGAGVYWWLHDVRPSSQLTAALLGAGVTGIAAGATLYFTNQEPATEGPRYIRSSTSLGVGVGAGGLVLTGIGLWLLHSEGGEPSRVQSARGNHKRRVSSMASVVASRSFLGLAGAF